MTGHYFQKWNHVALSFPLLEKDSLSPFPLGKTLRLFSSRETLQCIAENEGLLFLQKVGGVKLQSIQPVPSQHSFKILTRKRIERSQGKDLLKRIYRRMVHVQETQKELDFQKLENYQKRLEKKSKSSPYLNLKSKITGQHFVMSFELRSAEKEKAGTYSSYGLSQNGTTIPWF